MIKEEQLKEFLKLYKFSLHIPSPYNSTNCNYLPKHIYRFGKIFQYKYHDEQHLLEFNFQTGRCNIFCYNCIEKAEKHYSGIIYNLDELYTVLTRINLLSNETIIN